LLSVDIVSFTYALTNWIDISVNLQRRHNLGKWRQNGPELKDRMNDFRWECGMPNTALGPALPTPPKAQVRIALRRFFS
jgi:hypothetical protein